MQHTEYIKYCIMHIGTDIPIHYTWASTGAQTCTDKTAALNYAFIIQASAISGHPWTWTRMYEHWQRSVRSGFMHLCICMSSMLYCYANKSPTSPVEWVKRGRFRPSAVTILYHIGRNLYSRIILDRSRPEHMPISDQRADILWSHSRQWALGP